MSRCTLPTILLLAAGLLAGGCVAPTGDAPTPDPAAPTVAAHPGSDPQAVEIALATMARMGGREAWNNTRYLTWRFFGNRLHHWDRATGDVRIEDPKKQRLVLMNVVSREGRAFEAGEEITDPAALSEALELGHQWWVNDSYWLIMPYKLLDPGVKLGYVDKDALPDGRAADVLELTFDAGVGYTPENRYRVWVARDSGFVEQWAFWSDAADTEPRFTLPWSDWSQFGQIWLARGHGQEMDWEIAAPAELAPSLFRDLTPAAN